MPIAKNLFDWGHRQLIVTINIYFSYIYEFLEKSQKIECQKKDMVLTIIGKNQSPNPSKFFNLSKRELTGTICQCCKPELM